MNREDLLDRESSFGLPDGDRLLKRGFPARLYHKPLENLSPLLRSLPDDRLHLHLITCLRRHCLSLHEILLDLFYEFDIHAKNY